MRGGLNAAGWVVVTGLGEGPRAQTEEVHADSPQRAERLLLWHRRRMTLQKWGKCRNQFVTQPTAKLTDTQLSLGKK